MRAIKGDIYYDCGFMWVHNGHAWDMVLDKPNKETKTVIVSYDLAGYSFHLFNSLGIEKEIRRLLSSNCSTVSAYVGRNEISNKVVLNIIMIVLKDIMVPECDSAIMDADISKKQIPEYAVKLAIKKCIGNNTFKFEDIVESI